MVMKTNVNSFYSILEKARSDNSVLVYASSAATYGNLSSPQTLNITNPENPYGFSKYMMDQIAFRFSNDNPNLKIVGLRFFNVYGPREYYKEKTASMIIQLGHQLLSQSRPKLFENSKNIYRDFVYIEDVIQAIVKSCNSKKNGTFNIGTGIPRSFLDVVNILQNELQTNFEVEYILNPYKGYQNHTQADISESTLNFDYSPSFSLEEGIKSYIPEIIRLHEE